MSELRSSLQIGIKLGNGHFGEVHLGSDPVHGDVAVKIYRSLPDEDPETWISRKQDLLREGMNLRKARHDHVVQVHHIVESDTDDAIHLVMELCEAGSLQGVYEAGPTPPSDVHKVATDICHGLGALHDREMLHRDIKPGNILVDGNGKVKLGDFGLVTDDIVLGYAEAAGYMDHLAPEIFNTRQSSSRSDFWALGMTLYRLLHGEECYAASPAPRFSVPDGNYANRLAWLPHVSSRWRRLIRAMLNDDPHARLASNGKVLDALAAIAGEVSWSCRSDGDARVWERFAKGRRIEVRLAPTDRKWIWTAISYPVGNGTRKTLGGSGGPVTKAIAEKGLRDYFDQ